VHRRQRRSRRRSRRRPHRRERHARRAAAELVVLPSARDDAARRAMTASSAWYRSDTPLAPADAPRPSISRTIRNWARARLPEPDVRDKMIVLYARQGLRRKSAWAGMFSEFHHALGALAFGERRGAAGVRIDFRSALYVDADRGPNWWTYFFTRANMPFRPEPPAGEVHLTRRLAKYGRYGGFCDLVNGATPYLYPMTWGVSRTELHRLLRGRHLTPPGVPHEGAASGPRRLTTRARAVRVS